MSLNDAWTKWRCPYLPVCVVDRRGDRLWRKLHHLVPGATDVRPRVPHAAGICLTRSAGMGGDGTSLSATKSSGAGGWQRTGQLVWLVNSEHYSLRCWLGVNTVFEEPVEQKPRFESTASWFVGFFFFFLTTGSSHWDFSDGKFGVLTPVERRCSKQSCYPTYGAHCMFWCVHNPPNSDMDYWIFNVHTDVKRWYGHAQPWHDTKVSSLRNRGAHTHNLNIQPAVVQLRYVIIIVIIYPLTIRVVLAQHDFTTSFHFSLFSTALWDLPNSRPVQSLMLSSHLFFCLPCLLPLFIVLQDGFGQTWWTGDMTILLQFASLYNGQGVFVWSNCLLDLGMDFLVINMVFVWDV